jgi:hypothetical protein
LSFTGCSNVPAARAGATVTTSYLSSQNTGTIGGFIKMERQGTDGVWSDVTMEILNYGIGSPNFGAGSPAGPAGAGVACPDAGSVNAILRIQRKRNNGSAGTCPIGDTLNSYEWVPLALYDTREGLRRDNPPANGVDLNLGGAMYYIALDVANLNRWFIPNAAPFLAGTGGNSKRDNGGFTVYFSDRRNNRNAAGLETGEFGWEDFVNPLSATGAPNGTLDAGEDVNANALLDAYGGVANYNGTYNSAPPGATAPLTTASNPTTVLNRGQVEVNRPILFRHALKLINGGNIIGSGVTGLTIVSENPVYVQGNWNASAAGWVNPDAATSIIADAVTLLSNNWSDDTMFASPYTVGNRNRVTQTWYRLAILGGKGSAFPQPAGTATDFGTDGGAHNFLRYLENGDQQVNYQGSIATFFYNRQALGTYKCCATVYGAPVRNYFFDINFLNPALLPPNTPVFRDMNAVGFSQELRPGR